MNSNIFKKSLQCFYCLTKKQGISYFRLKKNKYIFTLQRFLALREMSTSINNECQSNDLWPPWRILFFGTDLFSLESLKVINDNRLNGNPKVVKELEVVTTPLKNNPVPVRQYANSNQLPIHDWPFCPIERQFDVGVVVSFGHMIPLNVIQVFPMGMLNVHGSLLPRWRGAAPIVHAILNGDEETGVTVMQIAPHEFDCGKIVLQQSCPIPGDMTAGRLTGILAKMGAKLLLQALTDLPVLLENSKPQDLSGVTKAPKLNPRRGVIKWDSQSCLKIDRLYRALNDTIKLTTSWHGTQVKLTTMLSLEETSKIDVNGLLKILHISSSDIRPGACVYHKKRQLLFISCQDGWVAFEEVIVKGHHHMTAKDFYNGFMTKRKKESWYFD